MYNKIQWLDEQGKLTELERETLLALNDGTITENNVIKNMVWYPKDTHELAKALAIYQEYKSYGQEK